MGVSIKAKSLKMDPDVFKRGKKTAARVFYKGLVDGEGDNPVTVTLEAPDEGDPVQFRDGDGVISKAIFWEHNFTTEMQEFFMDVDVVVGNATGIKTPCQIQITAGDSSDFQTIFHKA